MAAIAFPQHSSELLEYLYRLYTKSQLCDIVIYTNDGKAFPSHRIVWGFASAYLHQLFLDSYDESRVNLDLTSDVLQNLLDYCYTGRLQVSEKSFPEIKQAAMFLQMHQVIDKLDKDYSINDVTRHNLEWDASLANMVALTTDIKVERDSFSEEEDVGGFPDLKEEPDLNDDYDDNDYEPQYSVDTTRTKKQKKTPQKRKSVKKQKISVGDNQAEVLQVKIPARKRGPKKGTKTKLTKIKPSKAEAAKTKKLGKVTPLKSKKNTGRKKSEKTVSKAKETKKKVTGKEKGAVRKSNVRKSQTLQTSQSHSAYKIYIPKGRSTQCDECDIHFASYHKLRRHKLKHHAYSSIQLLFAQFILKRCLKGKQKLSSKLSGKLLSKKISSKLNLRSSVKNSTKSTQIVSSAGLMKFLAVKIKQYKTLGTQKNERDVCLETASGVHVPRKKLDKGTSEGVFECTLCKKQLTAQYSLYKHLQKPQPSSQMRVMRNYNAANMASAIEMFKKGGLSMAKAAKMFGVPRTTLYDKLTGRSPEVTRSGVKTVLTLEEEKKLVNYARSMAEIGYTLTRKELALQVKHILDLDGRKTPFKDNLPGRDWYYAFKARNPDFSMKPPAKLGRQHLLIMEETIKGWFEGLRGYLKKEVKNHEDLVKDPRRIFDAGESHFPIYVKSNEILAQKDAKHEKKVSQENKTQITVMASLNAAGDYMPPLIVYPGQRFKDDILSGFEEAIFCKTPDGLMDSEIFTEFIHSFDKFVLSKGIKKPVLLFVDGHKMHMSLETTRFCQDNGIVLYCLLNNATFTLQACDKGIFSKIKAQWNQNVEKWHTHHPGEVLTKKHFPEVFKTAWDSVCTLENSVSVFKKAGLFPLTEAGIDLTRATDKP